MCSRSVITMTIYLSTGFLSSAPSHLDSVRELMTFRAQQGELAKRFDSIAINIENGEADRHGFITMVQEDLKKATRITQERETEITNKLNLCLEILNKGKEENDTTQSVAALFSNNNASTSSLDAQSDFILFYALQSDNDQLISHYQITKTLEYDQIRSREAQIGNAHAETFKWLLDESQNEMGFAKWLKNDSRTYWIQGKPGAGKSTLMKHICQQPRTYEHLECWAQGKSLITAKYFSWFAGTNLQKSLEGLLRSLLLDIFTKRPRLIRDIKLLEPEDIRYAIRKGSYNTQILESLLERLIKKTPTMRYCFFIDGLDEFAEPHAKLITTINSLAKHKNLKLCVSSRPLPPFADAYGGDPENQLKVESLTYKDIQSFVSYKLNANKPFQTKVSADASYQILKEEPVEKSRGIFLWVVLIVRSLLEGLTNGDPIEVLKHRLAEFPEELKDFLLHILESVDERYRKETVEAFRIAFVCEDAIPLILFSALFEMKSDLHWPLVLTREPRSSVEIVDIHKDTRRRLDTRCKGLLEVVDLPRVSESHTTLTVHWLHPCVKEFLRTSGEVERILGVDMKDGPNACLLVCGAYLGVTKWLPNYEEDLIMSDSFDAIVFHPFCTIANKLYRYEPDPLGVSATKGDVETLHTIILELEKTLQEQWPTCYPKFAYRVLELDWEEYIEYRMKSGDPILAHIKEQLLRRTIEHRRHNPNLDIMKILLDHGADPNGQLRAGRTQTPWTSALRRYMSEKKKGRSLLKIVGALELLAAKGGDPNAPILNQYAYSGEAETTAREIIENYIDYPELRGIKLKPMEADPSGWVSGLLGWLRPWKDWVMGKGSRGQGRVSG